MKKVAILGPAYPLRGGIAEFNNSLCEAFVKAGFDCKVFSFSLQYPSILFPGKTQYTTDKREINFEINETLNSVAPWTWSSTAKLIKKFAPDFVLTAYWIPFTGVSQGVVLSFLKKSTKTIALAHNIIPHDKKPFDKAITRFFLKQNKAVVLLSDAVEKELDRFDNKKPRLVAFHPVYEQFGEPVERSLALEKLKLKQGKYVLFFGLIKRYKGLDILLKAFAEEELKESDIKLIIAGEFYDSKERYMELIKEYGIDDKIILHQGFVPDSMVKYYFSAADALVLPYRSATQSGVTQIAYHFDLPMIASDVGALPDLVPHGKAGFVFQSGDYKALAKSIMELYQGQNLQRFRSFVQQEKQKYSWKTLVERIDSFVSSV